ncbi:GNAT family N-acetyltransferase [Pseudohoeflea suaedae]|uniref:GNAT family N-acetyltransferase n=1 Tax=Pseudohoeflea suaedae TaxID=877384 RepID=A0A4R5PQI3_9HYPH|nr:GNAT family N-acetyltransferase [Pseudohoeflea suaedae]TDH39153.1 GNAT family N-acetyltransferase [Pseudohoeflea suaedae]
MLQVSSDVVIRQARRDDVAAIAAMFAADALGGHGDTADAEALPSYLAAFDWIEKSPGDRLWVAEKDGEVVGTYQSTFTRTLTGRGSSSLTIGAVHTRHDLRGAGIGSRMIEHAIAEGRGLGVRLVQLMSNDVRTDAHRFYERLGFVKSHAGFKMKLR